MRSLIVPALFALLSPLVACGGGDQGAMFTHAQCEDGKDNDGDGTIDFPDDLSCASESDDDESADAAPQCKDGRDNDGDGKIDYPTDPGCFAPNQDDETDDCPDGPLCPQCSDGVDNDENGQTDWPNDSLGCAAASDTDEYTRNLAACGSNAQIKPLPFDGHATGTLGGGGASNLVSMCGGVGVEDIYEIRIQRPKVLVATTENSAADTVLYLRGANCSNMASEMACNDNVSTALKGSTLTIPLSTKGTYYLVVDSKDSAGGAYDLQVRFLTGEGESCSGADDCGPGLVCRVPKNGTTKACAKHVCEDGVDDDDDGKLDYPNDPGCTSLQDDDESDGCPGVGTTCPECGDGFDNDGDGKTDFGSTGDTTCTAASDASEACVSTDGVATLTGPSTAGTTVGAVNDVKVACTSSSHTAPDKTYRLDLPAMASLTIANDNTFDASVALYNSTCTGTALLCKDEPETLTFTNLAAGAYYYVVDGYSSGTGAYTVNVSGKIQAGASCESALAQAGAITCAVGYTCAGTMGSRTCQPSVCLDGMDNDGDGKIDYPNDPGCADAADNNEADPGVAPVCSNTSDDDGDGARDWPADFGCAAASGTTEVFCSVEMDAPAVITSTPVTGTTSAGSNDHTPGTSCVSSSNAPDKALALHLPVPVASLVLNSSGFDTVLSVKSLDCSNVLACMDGSETSPYAQPSTITLSQVSPGGYAVIVDAYSTNSGNFTLTVKGTVAAGTRCDSPLFTGGANAVLECPTGTTCTGSPKKCQ